MSNKKMRSMIEEKSLSRRCKRGRFSIGEIKGAGLTLQTAKLLGVPIDQRRMTSHFWNVRLLKRCYVVIPLTEIKGIGEVTSMDLKNAGVSYANDLARCNLNKLSGKVKYSIKMLRKWQIEARKLIKKRTTNSLRYRVKDQFIVQ